MQIVLNHQSFRLMKAQHYAEPLALLNSSIEQDPLSWASWYLAGQCHRFINDIGNAITYLQKVVELKPGELPV
jgi:tetratricopeptide (TPR) repeat protein